MNNKIDIIIPCYNEDDNIQYIVNEIDKYIKKLSYHVEIIFIDDGSTDNTYETIIALSNKRDNIKVAKLSKNFGKESAIAAGLMLCDADAVIIIDADLQHPPDLIPILITEWENGADIVDAVKRFKQSKNLLKNFPSLIFYKIMNTLTDMDFDGSSDYKLLDRKAVHILNTIKEKNRFMRGLTNWIGLRHCKIEFTVDMRKSGESKFSWVKLFQLSIDAITSYTAKPLHLVTILGFSVLGFSLILGLQTLYNKFYGNAVSGFTTVILVILCLSSIMMISIGILGIYLSRIYNEVKERPLYIIEKSNMFENQQMINKNNKKKNNN